MARANLSALLGSEREPKPDTSSILAEEAPLGAAAVVAHEGATRNKTPRSANMTSSDEAPSAAPKEPPYLRLARKEARVREDQYEALTVNARRLTRAKVPGGERITENTLIRVAIDLLLSQADNLSGSDEAGLRKSVGL